MHRLIVLFLSAFDAAIAVAVGIAATLAPLTLLWVFALGDTADWRSLWPAGAVIWQLGHLVPFQISLAGDYLAEAGIAQDAASFVLSLAPLAFATFTAIFAWRSGTRASRAGAWGVGVLTSALVAGVLAALIGTSSQNPVAAAPLWQSVLFPTLLFAVPALAGGIVTEWREASEGWVARVRDRVEEARGGWGVVVGVSVRASAAALVGLIGAGALSLAVAFMVRAGDIVALYEAGNFDVLGAVVVTLAQFAYLPTLVVWGISFVTGPGFSVGEGTAVSPSGTQVGVLPGIPALGLIPESSSPWLLLVVLIPIAVGAFAGWLARSHMARPAPEPPAVTASAAWFSRQTQVVEPFLPRLVVAVAAAALSAGGAALLAVFASGSLGPGRFSHVGPSPGPVALAVGLEVLVGAAIMLLSPRSGSDRGEDSQGDATQAVADPQAASAPVAVDQNHTAPPLPVVPGVPTAAAVPAAPPLPVVPVVPAAPPLAAVPAEPSSPGEPAAPPAAASVDPDADTAPIDLPKPPDTGGESASVD